MTAEATKAKKTARTIAKKAIAKRAAKKRSRREHEALTRRANESTLMAWKEIYAKRDRFGKFD